MSIYSQAFDREGGLIRNLFFTKVNKFQGRLARMLNVLYNNTQTFKSPFITAELLNSLYYGIHLRSNPG